MGMMLANNKILKVLFLQDGDLLEHKADGSLFSQLIKRWSVISERKALLEAYFLCSFLPVSIGLLFCYDTFAYVWVGQYQLTKADIEYIASVIIFAPVLETLLLFVPFFELSRKYRVKEGIAVLSLSVLFELLHYDRSWVEHAYIYPTGFFFCMLYVSSRKRSFLHAAVFTIFIHLAYNLTVFLLPADWRYFG